MKAHLLFPDRDFDGSAALPWNEAALIDDLALGPLFTAMACGDERVQEAARRVILAGADNDLETIRHRQRGLEDCLQRPSVVREIYALAVEAIEVERMHYLGSLSRYPEWQLSRSVEQMADFLELLKRLRTIADKHARGFASPAWTRFFSTTQRELNDGFFERARAHLGELRLRHGLSLSAGLGKANKGAGYTLHRPPRAMLLRWWLRLWRRWFPPMAPPNSFDINPRDESGLRALEEVRRRGIGVVALALARSLDHAVSFFDALRSELAFYVGCINLRDALAKKGDPMCAPQVGAAGLGGLAFSGLYDVALALTIGQHVIGNDADLDGQNLVFVTGANRGGKSTFLRSVGQAQLMAQAGMFAPAKAFRSSLCDGMFTHFKREEDAGMRMGKLDEELHRMSQIVDHMTGSPLILFNEPFAATNEREGTEIAGQILTALLGKPARMICVTHLYELAHHFSENRRADVGFLRADRQERGGRTFKILPGEPLETSFGEDLYRDIFEPMPGGVRLATRRGAS